MFLNSNAFCLKANQELAGRQKSVSFKNEPKPNLKQIACKSLALTYPNSKDLSVLKIAKSCLFGTVNFIKIGQCLAIL